MLTRPQIILLKRAQAQAGIEDAEYRDTLEQLCGVRSSKDPKLTDGQLDQLMAYFEAIFWRGIDQGALKESCNRTVPFRVRGFWAAKNPKNNSSRAQYTSHALDEEIQELEGHLAEYGCGENYFAAIRRKTGDYQYHYRAALQRTLKARQHTAGVPAERRPF